MYVINPDEFGHILIAKYGCRDWPHPAHYGRMKNWISTEYVDLILHRLQPKRLSS